MRIDGFEKCIFFWVGHFWIFFFSKKNKKNWLIPWKAVKGSWLARMGQNFDYYPGFQPMRSWTNTYAQDCKCCASPLKFEDLLVIGTRCFKFPTQVLHWNLPGNSDITFPINFVKSMLNFIASSQSIKHCSSFFQSQSVAIRWSIFGIDTF